MESVFHLRTSFLVLKYSPSSSEYCTMDIISPLHFYSVLEFLLHICCNFSICSPRLNCFFILSVSLSLCVAFWVNYSGISFNSLTVSSTVSALEFVLFEFTSRMILFIFRISHGFFFTSIVNTYFYFVTFFFYNSLLSLLLLRS